MQSYDWLQHYIGKPFQFGASGPDAFDCWGLVVCLYREILKQPLYALHHYPKHQKDYPRTIYQESQSSAWRITQTPKFGTLALFARRRTQAIMLPEHIGFVVPHLTAGLFILHAVKPDGVVCEPMERLKNRGLYLYNFYHQRFPHEKKCTDCHCRQSA